MIASAQFEGVVAMVIAGKHDIEGRDRSTPRVIWTMAWVSRRKGHVLKKPASPTP